MKMNKKVVASVGLIGVLAVGGTFAYYNQTLSLDNPLSTGHYENQLVEKFTPDTDKLAPGANIDKDVLVQNTGDYPVVVRVKMDEEWTRAVMNAAGEATGTTSIIDHASSENTDVENANIFAVDPDIDADGYFLATQSDANAGKYTAETDGYTDGDWSVVAKMLNDDLTHWTFNEDDGYWYYNVVLEAGQSTDDLLDYLLIAENIDLGLYDNTDWYYIGDSSTVKNEIDEAEWVIYTINKNSTSGEVESIEVDGTEFKDLNNDGLVNAIDLVTYLTDAGLMDSDSVLFRRNESLLNKEHKGYADANYTLTITTEVVQATSDAVIDSFGTDDGTGTKSVSSLPQDIQDLIDTLDAN